MSSQIYDALNERMQKQEELIRLLQSEKQQREPKLPLPERFTGNRQSYRTFRNQVDTIFHLNASRFTDDRSRILFIGSLLSGDAAA